MADANDMDLLREFASRNSETAFAELVRRHINLVYSVAMRFTGNTGDAQDVTQAVFIILARKAAGLSARIVLTGWLYETTRFTAIRLLRTQARRQAREQEASMQSTLEQAGDDTLWRQLAPHLEAAMSRLAERDRTLLALRFYDNKTGAEAAALLGIREEAARKRTNRALEKLRKFFAKRGVDSTAATIAGTISANSVQAAPVALAKAVTAIAVAKGATASASTLTIIKGALKIMAWTKAKTSIAVTAVLIFATGSTVVAVRQIKVHHENKIIAAFVEKNNPYFGSDDPDIQKVRAMGADAVPFLVGYIEKYNSIRDTPRNQQSRYPEGHTLVRIRAYWGLGALHSAAKSAIPFLIQQFTTTNDLIDFDGDALAGFGEDAKAAVPTLINALHSSNQQFQWEGAYVLAQVDPNNAELLPVILAGMKSPDAVNRRFACIALGEMGTNAQPVLSVLTNALQDEDEWVRKQATKAVVEINSAAGQAK